MHSRWKFSTLLYKANITDQQPENRRTCVYMYMYLPVGLEAEPVIASDLTEVSLKLLK